MSESDPAPMGSPQPVSQAVADKQLAQTTKAFDSITDRLTPWFIDVGTWVFGGFIAFDLLMLAPLIQLGHADLAVLISSIAFALALPLHVAGLLLLRLVQDLKTIRIEEEGVRAFQEAGFTVGSQLPALEDIEARRTRRTQVALVFCSTILTLGVLLAVIGLTAALWHIAWWIAVAFLAMALISQGAVIIVISAFPAPYPPEMRAQIRRYEDAVAAQAKARERQNEGQG